MPLLSCTLPSTKINPPHPLTQSWIIPSPLETVHFICLSLRHSYQLHSETELQQETLASSQQGYVAPNLPLPHTNTLIPPPILNTHATNSYMMGNPLIQDAESNLFRFLHKEVKEKTQISCLAHAAI